MSLHKISSDFKKFIFCVLGRARLKEKTIQRFTDDKSMELYMKAFTDKSYDKHFNYEKLELHGDAAVNLSGILYLREKFPSIVSKGYLTKLKHKIVGEDWIPKLALSLKFDWWLRYKDGPFKPRDRVSLKEDIIIRDRTYSIGLRGEIVKFRLDQALIVVYFGNRKSFIWVPTNSITHNDIWKMLEDVFEAFCGALLENIDQKAPRGTGFAVVYAIIKSVYEMHPISLKWSQVADPKTRLKELYDQHKWEFSKLTSWRKIREHLHSVRISLPEELGGEMIVGGKDEEGRDLMVSDSKKKVWDAASKKALTILWGKGIKEKPPSPYVVASEEIPPPLVIPDTFKGWVKNILLGIGINSLFVDKLVQDKYMTRWLAAFINPDYNAYWNLELPMFVGVGVIDYTIIDYLIDELPKKTEGLSTNIKKNFMTKERRILSGYALKNGFDKYVLYGERTAELFSYFEDPIDNRRFMELLDKVFKAFVGVLYNLSVAESGLHGVGYTICFVYMKSIMGVVELTQKKDAKTKLREIFQTRKWKFGPPDIITEHNEETKKFTVTIYGYPLRDKKPVPKNRKLLGRGINTKSSEAEQLAAAKALNTLKRYRIS